MIKPEPYNEETSNLKNGVVGVIYSNPDGGKSTLLLTLTKNYKTLYFDVEGLATSQFKKIPDHNKNPENLFLSKGLENLNDVLLFLDTKEALDYDVIVIDSITYLVGVMTAKANPASLKGNGVFAYYREVGRIIYLILEKAEKKGINLFMSFQASNDEKKNGGAWGPRMDGSEGPDRIRDLSSLMIFIEKTGFNKRTIWQNTSDSFAYTKSKALPVDHKEKVEFEGMQDFSIDFLLGGEKLPTIEGRKKAQEYERKRLKEERSKMIPDMVERIGSAKTMEELRSLWIEAVKQELSGEELVIKEKDKRKAELESETTKPTNKPKDEGK